MGRGLGKRRRGTTRKGGAGDVFMNPGGEHMVGEGLPGKSSIRLGEQKFLFTLD